MMEEYPVAQDGIFWSIQGEAHLRGFQMAFLRLAGCSVGCPQCDTNYKLEQRLSASQITERLCEISKGRDRWVWITGGEPLDHPLRPLYRSLRGAGFSIAIATSGVHRAIESCDWMSVSPHGTRMIQRYGHEVKLIDGLNGLDLWDWHKENPDDTTDFWYRYAQPLTLPDGTECPKSLSRCLEFLQSRPNWSLSRQEHRLWGLP